MDPLRVNKKITATVVTKAILFGGSILGLIYVAFKVLPSESQLGWSWFLFGWQAWLVIYYFLRYRNRTAVFAFAIVRADFGDPKLYAYDFVLAFSQILIWLLAAEVS